MAYFRKDPPPCNSGIIRILEDPNIIPIIPYSHYYWVGGPPKAYYMGVYSVIRVWGRGAIGDICGLGFWDMGVIRDYMGVGSQTPYMRIKRKSIM